MRTDKTLSSLDKLAPWILKIDFKDGQWHVLFHPGVTVVSFTMEEVVKKLQRHVMYEVILLGCEALNAVHADLLQRTRERDIVDKRMAIANVLLRHFDHIIPYTDMAKLLGWSNHCMILHSRNNADVVEIKVKINKIYSKYNFLADGFKTLR